MPIVRRVFVSVPDDRHLTAEERSFKAELIAEIERRNLVAEIFSEPKPEPTLVSNLEWTPPNAERLARHCIGALIVGLPRWRLSTGEEPLRLTTEFCQYEGALARLLHLPTLILVQQGIRRRCVFDDRFGAFVVEFPEHADAAWLRTDPEFKKGLAFWEAKLARRRDIFLGYSGSSAAVAQSLKDLLEEKFNATVLEYQSGFDPGRFIFDLMVDAGERCSAGIFLFTKDDKLAGGLLSQWSPSGTRTAVPRDNVIFEAGYFMSAKGQDRVLIVKEVGARMPANLGGNIYASLDKARGISSIEADLRKFVKKL